MNETLSHVALSGKRAGEGFSAGSWMVGGVFLGFVMPLISHAMKKPEPPDELIATLPVEQRLLFADAYGDAAKSKRNRFAWIGMGFSFGAVFMLLLLIGVDISDEVGAGVDFGAAGPVDDEVPGGQIGGSLGELPLPPRTSVPVRVGSNIREPRKIFHVDPAYPELARLAGVTGVVVLDAFIDRNGRVTHFSVLESTPLLDQAAMDAVRLWRYEPTVLNGVAVPIVMTVTVQFSLD